MITSFHNGIERKWPVSIFRVKETYSSDIIKYNKNIRIWSHWNCTLHWTICYVSPYACDYESNGSPLWNKSRHFFRKNLRSKNTLVNTRTHKLLKCSKWSWITVQKRMPIHFSVEKHQWIMSVEMTTKKNICVSNTQVEIANEIIKKIQFLFVVSLLNSVLFECFSMRWIFLLFGITHSYAHTQTCACMRSWFRFAADVYIVVNLKLLTLTIFAPTSSQS